MRKRSAQPPSWYKRISCYADRWWYPLLLAGVSAADAFVFVIPNEPILIAAILPQPRRWRQLAVWTAIGSALGVVVFAWLVSTFGVALIHSISPSLVHSETWRESVRLIHKHGTWGLAAISFSPIPQHPAALLVGLAHMKLTHIFLAVLLGRTIKYLLFGWVGARAPETLVKWRLLPRWVLAADRAAEQRAA